MRSVRTAPAERAAIKRWRSDWLAFASEVLRVKLDADQARILRSVQHNSRTAVRSGHARGKDFTAAVCALCFLYLRSPSKVILTAPTDRQVRHIMIPEAKRIWMNAAAPLGGTFNTDGIKFERYPEWFLLGFKPDDNRTEAWTGFHSPNILVIVTEASGFHQRAFDAMEGLLTGDSRLLLLTNPVQTSGEAYEAFRSPLYEKFTLSCLNAPNVVARRILIHGQVDHKWIETLMQKPGWVLPIPREEAREDGDFEWDGQWYRASDLFRVKVMGLWPKEPPDQLIPLAWVETAQERWREWAATRAATAEPLRLGVDVAGMGTDLTVLCRRRGNLVESVEAIARADHMVTAGRAKAALDAAGENAAAYIDTIGEGAGVHSRLCELKARSVSVKFSESALGYADLTGERTFANMRAFCWWAIRDALDPEHGVGLAIPPNDELAQDLTAPRWSMNSQGRIIIEPKEKIRERLSRSPDFGDALANTFYPREAGAAFEGGVLTGLGIF